VFSEPLYRACTIAVMIRTLSVHKLKLSLVCLGQNKPFNVQPSLICQLMCDPGLDSGIIFGLVNRLR